LSHHSEDSGNDIVAHAIETAIRAGAEQADAVFARSRSLEARVRDDVTDFVKQAQEKVLGIRALVRNNGGLSSATTSISDLGRDSVTRMAEDTVALARATAPDPSAGLPNEDFATDIPDLALFDAADRNVSADARIEDAQQAESAARGVDARIQNSEGSQIGSGSSEIVYGNSKGFIGAYESASHSLFCEPIAVDGGAMQRDYWMTVGRTLAELDSPASVGEQAARRALRRLGAKRAPTCEAPVIFEARLAAGLIGQLAGLVSGYSVYRETSFLGDKLGQKIAPESVSVIDDGRLPGGLGSRPFDGEGLATRRNVVVQAGRLETWLLDSYAGRKLGMASTGNARRGVGGPPSVGTTNLWLEPGEPSLDAMIASTDRGLLVTELMGMGFNPVTGDYSRGATGLWIEDGAIVHPVEEITIAGNFGDMLMNIDSIGSELLWLGSVAAPPIRIASMMIAGD
jgi:PmbA protein